MRVFPTFVPCITLSLTVAGFFVAPTRAEVRPGPWPVRGYACVRANGPIDIDGSLEDETWESAAWSEPFVDIEGDRRPAPRLRKRRWRRGCRAAGTWSFRSRGSTCPPPRWAAPPR